MRRYRTEIVVPPDRLVILRLPTDLPTGRASVIVLAEESDAAELADFGPESEDDFEWWDEFGDAEGVEPWGLHVRLSALET